MPNHAPPVDECVLERSLRRDHLGALESSRWRRRERERESRVESANGRRARRTRHVLRRGGGGGRRVEVVEVEGGGGLRVVRLERHRVCGRRDGRRDGRREVGDWNGDCER